MVFYKKLFKVDILMIIKIIKKNKKLLSKKSFKIKRNMAKSSLYEAINKHMLLVLHTEINIKASVC